MDEEEKREDSLTDDEARDVEEQDITGEEAHREGEFDDLRDLIEGLRAEIRKGFENLKETQIAKAVENGGTIHEDEDDLDLDDVPALDELDLTI